MFTSWALPPHVIEASVNHLSGFKAGVAGRYNAAQYMAERTRAMQLRADHLSQTAAPAKVVEMPARTPRKPASVRPGRPVQPPPRRAPLPLRASVDGAAGQTLVDPDRKIELLAQCLFHSPGPNRDANAGQV